MSLHKVHGNRAPRQRFKSQRARTSEQIQHASLGNRLLQDTEPRFAYSIRRGSHLPRRRLESTPLELTRYDAEQDSPPAPESTSAPASRPVPAERRRRVGS